MVFEPLNVNLYPPQRVCWYVHRRSGDHAYNMYEVVDCVNMVQSVVELLIVVVTKSCQIIPLK